MANWNDQEAELRQILPELPEIEGVSAKQKYYAQKQRLDFLKSIHGKICIELDKLIGTEAEDGQVYTVELLRERLRNKLDIQSLVLFDVYQDIVSTDCAADIIDTIECLYRYY